MTVTECGRRSNQQWPMPSRTGYMGASFRSARLSLDGVTPNVPGAVQLLAGLDLEGGSGWAWQLHTHRDCTVGLIERREQSRASGCRGVKFPLTGRTPQHPAWLFTVQGR